MNEDMMPHTQPKSSSKLDILKSKRALCLIGAVVAVLAVAFLLIMRGNDNTDVGDEGEGAGDAVTVEITDEGFEPEAIQINAGTTVMWTNTDSQPHGLRANPYPEGTEFPDLDSGDPIAPGSSYSFTFNEVGEYGYHDKEDPTDNGEVIVQ